MYIANVVGTIVATRKVEELIGKKFLIVTPCLDGQDQYVNQIVVDVVGAGIGETVLVATGGAARTLPDTMGLPIDAVAVGIVSNIELHKPE